MFHFSRFFNDEQPSWSGYMSIHCHGSHNGKSTISFLRIINLKPTDLSCIYSSLKLIVEQPNSIGMETAVVTFDQPLWLKATEIVRSKDLPIVLILGGFHTMISYMGSIGAIMKGSGIHESLETIYGSNAVDHILSGKAVSRAVRARFLTVAVLKNLLLEEKFLSEENRQSKRRSNRIISGSQRTQGINER